MTRGEDPEFRYNTRDMGNDNYEGQSQIRAGGGIIVQYKEEGGSASPIIINYQGSQQYLFANPITGGLELYNPTRPAQDVPAPPGTTSTSNHSGYEGIPSSRDFVDTVTVVSPMIQQMQGHEFGIAVEAGSLIIMGGSALRTSPFIATTGADIGLAGRGTIPAPGTRTFQGYIEEVVGEVLGNPTVQRGGQDLFRVRASGHGSSTATVTPQNVRNVAPNGNVFIGSGADQPVTPGNISELYKAMNGYGTSTIRTRGGKP